MITYKDSFDVPDFWAPIRRLVEKFAGDGENDGWLVETIDKIMASPEETEEKEEEEEAEPPQQRRHELRNKLFRSYNKPLSSSPYEKAKDIFTGASVVAPAFDQEVVATAAAAGMKPKYVDQVTGAYLSFLAAPEKLSKTKEKGALVFEEISSFVQDPQEFLGIFEEIIVQQGGEELLKAAASNMAPDPKKLHEVIVAIDKHLNAVIESCGMELGYHGSFDLWNPGAVEATIQFHKKSKI